MSIKEFKDFQNSYKQIGFTKEYSFCSMKRQKKNIYYHLQQN